MKIFFGSKRFADEAFFHVWHKVVLNKCYLRAY